MGTLAVQSVESGLPLVLQHVRQLIFPSHELLFQGCNLFSVFFFFQKEFVLFVTVAEMWDFGVWYVDGHLSRQDYVELHSLVAYVTQTNGIRDGS